MIFCTQIRVPMHGPYPTLYFPKTLHFVHKSKWENSNAHIFHHDREFVENKSNIRLESLQIQRGYVDNNNNKNQDYSLVTSAVFHSMNQQKYWLSWASIIGIAIIRKSGKYRYPKGSLFRSKSATNPPWYHSLQASHCIINCSVSYALPHKQ